MCSRPTLAGRTGRPDQIPLLLPRNDPKTNPNPIQTMHFRRFIPLARRLDPPFDLGPKSQYAAARPRRAPRTLPARRRRYTPPPSTLHTLRAPATSFPRRLTWARAPRLVSRALRRDRPPLTTRNPSTTGLFSNRRPVASEALTREPGTGSRALRSLIGEKCARRRIGNSKATEMMPWLGPCAHASMPRMDMQRMIP